MSSVCSLWQRTVLRKQVIKMSALGKTVFRQLLMTLRTRFNHQKLMDIFT